MRSVQVNYDDVFDEDVGDDDKIMMVKVVGTMVMIMVMMVMMMNADGVQAEGGCSTSGKCPMQAPGSLTTPDLHPASIANEKKKRKS